MTCVQLPNSSHTRLQARRPFTLGRRFPLSGDRGTRSYRPCGPGRASLRSCEGGALTEAEEALLGDGLENNVEEALAEIWRVGEGERPEAARLETALLAVEQASLRNPQDNIQGALDGTWILSFATVGPIKYVPVLEYVEICMKDKTMSIVTELGILEFNVFGIFTWDMDRNLIVLQISQFKVKVFGSSFSFNVPGTKKYFTFFHADSTVACFRAGKSGIVLMVSA